MNGHSREILCRSEKKEKKKHKRSAANGNCACVRSEENGGPWPRRSKWKWKLRKRNFEMSFVWWSSERRPFGNLLLSLCLLKMAFLVKTHRVEFSPNWIWWWIGNNRKGHLAFNLPHIQPIMNRVLHVEPIDSHRQHHCSIVYWGLAYLQDPQMSLPLCVPFWSCSMGHSLAPTISQLNHRQHIHIHIHLKWQRKKYFLVVISFFENKRKSLFPPSFHSWRSGCPKSRFLSEFRWIISLKFSR